MHRFYCPNRNVFKDKIIINDPIQLHHIKDVLRLKEKDKICIFDGTGSEYIGFIREISYKDITVVIKEKVVPKDKQINITLACAIPKKSKMDEIIDKLTQLGVDTIIPLETERIIVRLDKNKKNSRLGRWQKVALVASQQSQRNKLPVIEPVKNIKEVLSESENYDLKLIPHLTGRRKTLKEVIAKIKPKNILVLIGPEGDFTPEEVDLAKKAGCIPISLGNSVLRVETAAVAVASFIGLYCSNK